MNSAIFSRIERLFLRTIQPRHKSMIHNMLLTDVIRRAFVMEMIIEKSNSGGSQVVYHHYLPGAPPPTVCDVIHNQPEDVITATPHKRLL